MEVQEAYPEDGVSSLNYIPIYMTSYPNTLLVRTSKVLFYISFYVLKY
jgi:hypothetical protein